MLAALLLASPAAVEESAIRWLTPEQISSALNDCDLKQITVSYEEEVQSNVVKIDDVDVSKDQLCCAFWATDRTTNILEWRDDLQARYFELAGEIWAARAKESARAYFRRRGDLDQLPTRQEDESEIHFARRLAQYCDPQAVGFFTDEFGGVAVSPDWLLERDYESIVPILGCLMQAAILVDLPVGFIGNEKSVE